MEIRRLLRIGNTPLGLLDHADATIRIAKVRAKGTTWGKWKVRLFKAGKIADALKWESNRLIEVKPEWAMYDIEPMLNITCNGDDGPWHGTPDGDRPTEGFFMNPDPESDEYKKAMQGKYCKGKMHPRSRKFRKMWYRRNGGAYLVYSKGMPVDTVIGHTITEGEEGDTRVRIYNSGDAWLIRSMKTLIKPRKILGMNFPGLYFKSRVGFEVDNVFSGPITPQMWFPIANHELLAPVTWHRVPTFIPKL